jgi:hypothetical protein
MLTGQTQKFDNNHTTQNAPALKDAHLFDLRRSGLSDETILLSRCHSASADEVKSILQLDVGPGLVFPYPGVLTSNGQPFCRVKPDQPPIINGKPAKYLTPIGEGNHLYIPPNVSQRVLADISVPLILTEGEKKSLKGSQEGFPTIGLSGVFCFKDKHHNPIPDFNKISWKERLVYAGFDSDIISNPMVRLAEWQLGAALYSKGALNAPLRFPHGRDGRKVGLDDYLILYGPEQLITLMAECKDSPLTRLLKEEYILDSILAAEGISISRKFDEKEPFYTIKPTTLDLEIWIEKINDKNGKITADISAYQGRTLLGVDRINVVRERERRAFIKKLNCNPDVTKTLIEKANHLPRIAEKLKAIQRLHRDADAWVETVTHREESSAGAVLDVKKEEALTLLKDPALLYRYSNACEKLRIAGEKKNSIIVVTALTSRKQENPISLLVKGESSSGKSYLLGQVVKLFPPEDIKVLTAMSKQAMIYSQESLSHKTIIIFEKHGMDQALYNIRSLQSEKKLIFETVEKDPEGGHYTRRIEKDGPTNFIVTTTSLRIHFENETRNWSIGTDESEEQTQAVKERIAERYNNVHPDFSFVETFQNAQRLLESYPVRIPYGNFLSSKTPDKPTRIRRDFEKLLAAIETIALLHQYQREIKEENGVKYIEAKLEDYYMVKEIFDEVFVWSLSGTNRKTQEAIAAVNDIFRNSGGVPVTTIELINKFQKTKETILRWLNPAIRSGEIEVVDSKGRIPKAFVPGAKHSQISGLPPVEELAQNFPELAKGFRVIHPLNGTIVELE